MNQLMLKLDKQYKPVSRLGDIYQDDISEISALIEKSLQSGEITKKQAGFLLQMFISALLKHEVEDYMGDFMEFNNKRIDTLFINSRVHTKKEEYVG